jgi:type I restriction enzyme S subunit
MTAREIHGAVDHITMEAVSSSATQLVPPGAVLVVVRSGILVRRLPIAITRVQVALNQDMKAFVCNDQVLPDFLAYFLESKESLILQNCVKKGATVHSIAMDRFTSLPVPIPAKKEQSRIVELLDEASRLRSLRREADAKAARILPALFLKMFGDPATNPKGFPKKPLGSLIKVRSGDFLPAKDMAQDGRCPVYGGNGINGYHDSYMFDDRKIVLGRVGVYCGVVHYSEPKAWITDNALYISEKFEPLDDYYLVAALEQAKLNQYAGRAGQPLISGSRIYPIEILVPPEAIQARFAKTVASLLSLDEIKTSASNRIDQLWGILMGRAFSGQLTAKWREAHLQELLAEMAQQARALNLPMPHELDASS